VLVLWGRRAAIDWAGRVHAYPVSTAEGVDFSRHGQDPAGSKRIGWKTFFGTVEARHLAIAVEGPDDFGHRILRAAEAHAELPPEAFGPPWYRRLWHELVLR